MRNFRTDVELAEGRRRSGLDSYAALGHVVTYETKRGRRWGVASKATG